MKDELKWDKYRCRNDIPFSSFFIYLQTLIGLLDIERFIENITWNIWFDMAGLIKIKFTLAFLIVFCSGMNCVISSKARCISICGKYYTECIQSKLRKINNEQRVEEIFICFRTRKSCRRLCKNLFPGGITRKIF